MNIVPNRVKDVAVGVKTSVGDLRSAAQRKVHYVNRVHHFADLAYLSTTFIENHLLHVVSVSSLIVIVTTLILVGEEEIAEYTRPNV